MKDPYEIIRHPLRTEKGTTLQADQNKYLFAIAVDANKLDVKYAVEKIYNVTVEKVNTMHYEGKPRRVRMALGKRPDWKKALVTLKSGDIIESQ